MVSQSVPSYARVGNLRQVARAPSNRRFSWTEWQIATSSGLHLSHKSKGSHADADRWREDLPQGLKAGKQGAAGNRLLKQCSDRKAWEEYVDNLR